MKIKFTFPHVYQRRPNGACQYAYHWQEQLHPLPRRYFPQRHGLGRIWAKPGESFWAAIARRQRDGERARMLAAATVRRSKPSVQSNVHVRDGSSHPCVQMAR